MELWKEDFIKTKEVGMFETDSDIEDFANAHGLTNKEVFHFSALQDAEGTACAGCRWVDCKNIYPCNCCKRMKKDMFELDE